MMMPTLLERARNHLARAKPVLGFPEMHVKDRQIRHVLLRAALQIAPDAIALMRNPFLPRNSSPPGVETPRPRPARS